MHCSILIILTLLRSQIRLVRIRQLNNPYHLLLLHHLLLLLHLFPRYRQLKVRYALCSVCEQISNLLIFLTDLPFDNLFLHGKPIKSERPQSTRLNSNWKPGAPMATQAESKLTPFKTYADLVIASSMKKLGASRKEINALLRDLRDKRFKIDDISFRNAKDIERTLSEGITKDGVKVSLNSCLTMYQNLILI